MSDKNEPIISEAKRNLLGSLEIALFMRIARERFGNSGGEALRSFAVPVLLFPLTVITMLLSPSAPTDSANIIALLFGLRMAFIWIFFFGSVYLITKEIDRKQYFYKFVIASNWLSVPATVVFMPILWMLMTGAQTWDQAFPLMLCVLLYTYAFTAFMATYVLRVPWELSGFIVFVGMAINDSTMDIMQWFGKML